MAFQPGARLLTAIRATVFVIALIPFARLILGAATNNLGANPTEFITRSTGEWALIFLCLTLAVTPLRHLSGWHWLARLRRMLGLYVFFYALLHFLTFIGFDHFFDFSEMWKDVLKRPFITVGFIAFVLLMPLAATSNRALVRRLGARSWQRLHRAVYLIAMLAILHFWWMRAGKNDFGDPLLYGAILTALLGWRLYVRLSGRSRSAA